MTKFLLRHFVPGYPESVNTVSGRSSCGILAGITGIVCNLLLCVFKFFSGVISGSVAISADAVNNLSDASSSIITLLGFRIASKPADEEHPYGHGRSEYLSGLAVSVIILIIGAGMVRSSIEKIISPSAISGGILPVLILAVSIVVKLWMASFNMHIGRLISSKALEATAADSRNDVISTGAVLASTILQMITGWQFDGWIGLCVAAFILWNGWGLIQDSIAPILGQMPDPELVKHINNVVKSYPQILGIHDLIVHDYGPGRQFASLHVEISADADVLKSHDVIDRIERRFLEEDGIHVVIHYDPVVTDDEETNEARNVLSSAARSIDRRLSIHDLRIVPGTTHTNIVFDLIVPRDMDPRIKEIKELLSQAASKHNNKWICVITSEHSFTNI
jgi:cation diffusion facilitator family transporter